MKMRKIKWILEYIYSHITINGLINYMRRYTTHTQTDTLDHEKCVLIVTLSAFFISIRCCGFVRNLY